jgi:hypothetical protein
MNTLAANVDSQNIIKKCSTKKLRKKYLKNKKTKLKKMIVDESSCC